MTWILLEKRKPALYTNVLITDGKHIGVGFLGLYIDSEVFRSKNEYCYNIFAREGSKDPLYGIIAWKHLPKLPRSITMRMAKKPATKKDLSKMESKIEKKDKVQDKKMMKKKKGK